MTKQLEILLEEKEASKAREEGLRSELDKVTQVGSLWGM